MKASTMEESVYKEELIDNSFGIEDKDNGCSNVKGNLLRA